MLFIHSFKEPKNKTHKRIHKNSLAVFAGLSFAFYLARSNAVFDQR